MRTSRKEREIIQMYCGLQLQSCTQIISDHSSQFNTPIHLTKDEAKIIVENAKTLMNVLIEEDLI